ncbi:hypothetical protein [Streptomyces rhizoryzae]|nr:hypothetical protein [Streptomyces rhizoryzae]
MARRETAISLPWSSETADVVAVVPASMVRTDIGGVLSHRAEAGR